MTDPSAAIPDEIAALGPFFAFDVHDDDGPPPQPWRTMEELARADSHVLRDRVTAVRGYLAAGGGVPAASVESRVAASVTHLGLVARLLSPVLALSASHGAPPDLDLARMRWQPTLGGLFPLSLPRRVLDPATPSADPGAFLEGPVRQLVDATAHFSVSRRVLWGNVASAVNGAVTAANATDPVLGRPIRDTAAILLDHPLLRDAFTREAPNGRFRRRSCCLIYRATPGAAPDPRALCGDCVLAGTARRPM